MQPPRALSTLRLLADGKVKIIGGDAELSMEILDPRGFLTLRRSCRRMSTCSARRSARRAARRFFRRHSLRIRYCKETLRPNTWHCLIAPTIRLRKLPSRKQVLVVGGVNSAGQVLNSAKLVSSSAASVTTDKTDYAPGQIVTITGTGFQSNEQVQISLHEFPEEYPDITFSTTVNPQGDFSGRGLCSSIDDLDGKFTLTAMGQ
jgi:hypothetical protein